MTAPRKIFKAPQGVDRRRLPAYAILEAAHYLDMPPATLRSWVRGRSYQTGAGMEFAKPIIELPVKELPLLSFVNLVEAYVLDAIRRIHKVSLQRVRKALDFLKKHFGTPHPLATQRFQTDGLSLFIEKYGQLINVTEQGQLAMRKLVEAYLQRIEYDVSELPLRLYPFTGNRQPEERRIIVIDPFVSFGRPILAGTGIATAVIGERYKAGESMNELAKDYGRRHFEIEEAIRCELQRPAA
jgi:uncharacterized protein (DUF433 family)